MAKGKHKNGRGRRKDTQQDSTYKIAKFLDFKGYGFPDRYACKLKYVQKLSFTGSVTPSNQVFRLDSLYDPDLSGIGHQPRYFDQIAGLYNQYLVTRCDWKLEFVNANSNAVTIGVAASDTSIATLPPDELCELNYSKSKVLGLSTGASVCTIRGGISLSELHGQPNRDSDPDMYAIVSASPQETSYLTIGVNSLDGTNCAVTCKATLIFHSVFKERIEPSSSVIFTRFVEKANNVVTNTVEGRTPKIGGVVDPKSKGNTGVTPSSTQMAEIGLNNNRPCSCRLCALKAQCETAP